MLVSWDEERGHFKHTLAYANKILLVHVISWKKYIEKDAEKALISKPSLVRERLPHGPRYNFDVRMIIVISNPLTHKIDQYVNSLHNFNESISQTGIENEGCHNIKFSFLPNKQLYGTS